MGGVFARRGGAVDKFLFGYEIERIYGRTLDWHTNQWLSSHLPPSERDAKSSSAAFKPAHNLRLSMAFDQNQ